MYLADSVVVFFVWWWLVVCKHETVSQGEIVTLPFDKSHPILQERGKDMKLYNDAVNATCVLTHMKVKSALKWY